MKIKALTLYSKILSFFLVILGYQACDVIDPVDEYGAPSAKYKVKGTVVSETEELPVKGVRAVLVETYDGEENPYSGDTIYTDADGRFSFEQNRGYIAEKFNLKLQDVDGESNGSFEDREVTVDFKDAEYEGKDGWYIGKAEKDMGKIILKNKTE